MMTGKNRNGYKIGVGLLLVMYMLNVVVVLMHCMMVEIDQSIKIICNTRTSKYLITIILKINTVYI